MLIIILEAEVNNVERQRRKFMNRLNRFLNCERKNFARYRVSIFAAVIMLIFAGASRAESDNADAYAAVEARIVGALSASTGGSVEIAEIIQTEANGLLEVTLTSGLVLYATETGEHFVVGDLYAIRNNGLVNLAEQKREVERKSLVDDIAIDEMIVFSPEGETRDYITVFTDVTCFYCQKLHREVDDLNSRGIEVRYLAYPRGGLDSEGAKQLATAWCADNKQETLTKFKAGESVPIDDCGTSPVASQYQLGVELGVRGTPAIVTSGGQMIPGYRPAADIAQELGLN